MGPHRRWPAWNHRCRFRYPPIPFVEWENSVPYHQNDEHQTGAYANHYRDVDGSLEQIGCYLWCLLHVWPEQKPDHRLSYNQLVRLSQPFLEQ